MKKCPKCADLIKSDAIVCRYCPEKFVADEKINRDAGSLFDPFENVKALARGNKNIDAIKAYRAQTGLGLKESKDAADEMMNIKNR